MKSVTEQFVNIIDDDDGVRDSIKELVGSVGLNTRVYLDALEYLHDFSQDHAGCIVLDLRMARMSGLGLQRKLNEMGASIPVIFLTGYGDVPTAVEAMKGGAVDFIQKPYSEQCLLDSINKALQSDLEQRSSLSDFTATNKRLESLTKREKEIMLLLGEGRTTRQIAELLAISPRTVEVHRQRVLSKLGFKSVSEIISSMSCNVV